ncbi:hypothetical protein XELAEV_18029778mg [Xenopus laevis]|uniref:Reverse transcriptase zinc-binding domain-containing protein n=1 Tax=Xenopus laevis TaxID=8355 RepID=A0A974HIE2_XENLA|nr:hypothetical protein XELAEV_18029778mg [Xenopus laevis]
MDIERFLAVKYLSLKEGLSGCMVRYAAGNVLRKYGLCEVNLSKPVCFKSLWFYVRVDRCIRRNNLENVVVKDWCENNNVLKLVEEREEMERIGGLTENESKKVWNMVNEKNLTNRQKDLAWMAVHGCLPTREFQRRRGLVEREICEREVSGKIENITHVFWNCMYAKEVWKRMGKMMKELTGVQILTFNMTLYGLCNIEGKQARILWLLVNCVKEVLWDVQNILIFNKTVIEVNECVNMIRGKLFLYV